MKWIQYQLACAPAEEEIAPALITKRMSYSEANLVIAQREAYQGQYTLQEDGQPEPTAEPSAAERIAQLELALDMLLSGVTE